MTTVPASSVVPAVGKPRPLRLPTVADHTLGNGLRVLIARRAGIPRFEGRLAIATAHGGPGEAPRLRVLTETMLAGTPRHSSRDIAEELQAMGGGLGSSSDAEQLLISGSSLSANRRPFLELFGEVVQQASFPANEVAIERERVVQEIALLRSQPGVVAGDALAGPPVRRPRLRTGTPDPDAVAGVGAAALRRLHGDAGSPRAEPCWSSSVTSTSTAPWRTWTPRSGMGGGRATRCVCAHPGGDARRRSCSWTARRGADQHPDGRPGPDPLRPGLSRARPSPSPCSAAISRLASTTTSASRRATPTGPTHGSSTTGLRPI